MKSILLPPRDKTKFAIFGKIHYLDYFIEKLHANGFSQPVVFISPEQQYERDRRLLEKYGYVSGLDRLIERGLAMKRVFDDVNAPECLKEISRYNCNVGFSINCRNIIKRPLIDFFEGRLFNIHDSFLPNERGGALNTWRILNDIKSVGNTIHLVDEGIDSGEIVFQEQVELKEEFPLPIDYDRAQLINCHKILDRFITACVENRPISLRPQSHAASIYLPRLHTEVNGAIDWNWDVHDVERFIRAFSDPYPGAFTFLKDRKVHILRARIAPSKRSFHPFCNGKVVNVLNDGSVLVVAGGKSLIVMKASWNSGEILDASNIFNIKHTLHTPREVLDRARIHVPKVQDMK